MHPALLVQIMFLEKLGSEILRRCQAVRAAFGCEVHLGDTRYLASVVPEADREEV